MNDQKNKTIPKPLTDEQRIEQINYKRRTGSLEKADILTIRDAQTRQRLIAENIALFTKKQ